MQAIPLQSVPSQTVRCVLGGQNCQIGLNQKDQGLFFDLSSDNVEIASAVICRDTAMLVSRGYSGFLGNLFFIDTQGSSDPNYAGLTGRFSLVYITAAENALI
jgi:hypothetical protein